MFLKPPSVEELEKRLRGRGTESEEQIQTRLAASKVELDRHVHPLSHDTCDAHKVMLAMMFLSLSLWQA